jgi:thiol-disulfide isomerase/thioredoxin
MNRRQLSTAAVAALALAAGVSWRLRPAAPPADVTPPPPAGPDGATQAAAVDPLQALWPLRFERPEGGELALAEWRGKPVLLNFWATWCPPCVKEMPMLDAFQRQHAAAGWQVIGLAVDGPTPVREFLGNVPVSFPIGLAGLDGVSLARSLGNSSGALPFTLVLGRDGQVRHTKLGALTQAELDGWAQTER